MHAISRARFDGLAFYARRAGMGLVADELAWFASNGEAVIAALIRDTDGEYSGQILMRDLDQRYRWVTGTAFFGSLAKAVVDLGEQIHRVAAAPEKYQVQGDESGMPMDFFSPAAPRDRLHSGFVRLAEGQGFVAARRLISAMMRWYDDVDGNFVEQFQTTGFDQRVWELYLFAALTEAGFDVERPDPAPDYLATGPGVQFALEAVTANPSIGPDGKPVPSPRADPGYDEQSYRRDYLPLKFAGPLTAKLKKQYWHRTAASGRPLVLAIQDFHDTMSMTYSGSALVTYLYGYAYEPRERGDNLPENVPTKIVSHSKGDTQIPSGFFFLPDAEHISAVLFNSTATLSKFNRMGVIAGFGSDEVTLVVEGAIVDPAEDATAPISFARVVGPDYSESWMDGTDVFHNPRAIHPLDPASLPGASHHRFRSDGTILSLIPPWKSIGSITTVLVFGNDEEQLA